MLRRLPWPQASAQEAALPPKGMLSHLTPAPPWRTNSSVVTLRRAPRRADASLSGAHGTERAGDPRYPASRRWSVSTSATKRSSTVR